MEREGKTLGARENKQKLILLKILQLLRRAARIPYGFKGDCNAVRWTVLDADTERDSDIRLSIRVWRGKRGSGRLVDLGLRKAAG